MSPTTAPSAGPRLRRARELAGIHERAAARELGIRRARLRDWESGAVAPDADEMARAVSLYSADLDEIWPDRQPLVTAEEPGILIVGDERIDLRTDALSDTGDIDNRVVLTRYLAAVRRQRGLEPSDRVELRSSDIASLASVLDLDDTALEAELTELLDLTPAGARWTARALVVGGLMAVAATTVVGASWFAAPTSAAAAPSVPTAVVATPFAPEASTTVVSDRAAVQFAPEQIADDAPIDAEIVEVVEHAAVSPFSTEPAAQVELAPAMFAVAPASDWAPVVDAVGALPSSSPDTGSVVGDATGD